MRTPIKEFFELIFWKWVKLKEHQLGNAHYQYFYTTYFSLENEFYRNKKILDIGCGPRGSLEWATEAKERVGVDPLADKYLRLGAARHQMTYIKAYAESLPFPDRYFDIISSFNSLDHVEDLEKSCREIQRTLKPGGVFLLIVDIHPFKTPTEPQKTKWTLIKDYFPELEILSKKNLERVAKHRIYDNLRVNKTLKNQLKKSGVLTAMLRK